MRIDLTEQFELLDEFKLIAPGRWLKQIDDRTQIICHFTNRSWEIKNYLIIEKIQTYMRKDSPNKFIKFAGQINSKRKI